jgi:hypothetical protein
VGAVYLLLTLTALVGWTVTPWALSAFAVSAVLLVHDLVWIDRRTTELNKQIRMSRFLRRGAKPPSGYRGRYTDDDLKGYIDIKERERAGHPADGDATPPESPGRVPSFDEQERLLRELARRKDSGGGR